MFEGTDRSGTGYQWRKLTPRQARAIAAAKASGVSARALAAEYRVSARTIYRAIESAASPLVVVVTVHAWHDGPIRVTEWHATGAPA